MILRLLCGRFCACSLARCPGRYARLCDQALVASSPACLPAFMPTCYTPACLYARLCDQAHASSTCPLRHTCRQASVHSHMPAGMLACIHVRFYQQDQKVRGSADVAQQKQVVLEASRATPRRGVSTLCEKAKCQQPAGHMSACFDEMLEHVSSLKGTPPPC